jgi:hypothetical protein
MLLDQRQANTFGDMKKTHPVAIRMDPDVKAALERLAAEDNRSLSSYVGLLLRRHVEEKQGKKAKG